MVFKVTPCGSGKFKPLIHGICEDLENSGFLIFKPPLHNMGFTEGLHADEKLLAWKGATFAHLQRIAKCDVCLIVNPGGYTGVSTTLELGYAVALQKVIVALQHDPEPARESLFDFVLETDSRPQAIERFKLLFQEKERNVEVI